MAFDSETFNKPEVTARDRLVMLRDFLAVLSPEQFDMDIWHGTNSCGTVACIAGWADHLFSIDNPGEATQPTAAVLGLDWDKAYNLFYPPLEGDTWSHIKAPQAVKVLDHLLATGEVDWDVAFK